MEFSREMKKEIMEEIMNGYAPDKLSQEKRISKVLWVAQCILRDEEETFEEIDFEGAGSGDGSGYGSGYGGNEE